LGPIVVRGGRTLTGEVRVAGAKNSALKLIAASLLAPGRSRLTNVPNISDVATMAEVVAGVGAIVEREDHALSIDATELTSYEAPYEVVSRMRASITVLGPLVARLGRARVAMPGGCNIGSRKVDMHIRGLEALGVHFELEHGYIEASTPEGLHGADVALEFPSVGATENLLMAAVLAEGRTTIENAAREPEIGDLVHFLQALGAQIEGGGTETIVIDGVEQLTATEHAVVGDRIEAGTYLVAGALGGGPVTVRGADPDHMNMVLLKLEHAGYAIDATPGAITVRRNGPVKATDIQTLPYPGFPTDMQPQLMAVMALAEGTA
jgi:UDP-N-acetylglucosamine 1-carboxyvinyltransferase